ncbi:MAG: NF038122 family metalloprotease, partial [Planctomycetes bacterium]|nr:NF038122 family metalloprotease [Planctomycetota bacterium]
MIGLRKRDSAKKLLRHRSAAAPVRSAGMHLQRLEARLLLAAEVSPFSIHLDLGPSLEANAPARAAILRAAEFWEGVLFDPVTINIDAEMTNDFPNNNTLALTNSTPVRFLYGDVRSRLIADASADESIVALLPTPEQLRFDLADDFRLNEFTDDVVVELTRANALALGFTDLPVHPDLANVVDASIKFNNFADFDFDNSDGVDSGSLDFEAVALHEIAHALGFLSNVDDVDFHLDLGTPRPRVDPTVMDLFRLAPDEGDSFSTARRILNTGDAVPVQVFHDGQFDVSVFAGTDVSGLQTGDIPMATGQQFGDGRQASHLKSDVDTGVSLGLLDPTVSRGRIGRISETVIRLLALIG